MRMEATWPGSKLNMDFTKLLNELFDVIEELAKDEYLDKEDKLEELTDQVAQALEQADDVVSLLPMGFAVVAKLVVDNPAVDEWQRDVLARPVAEMAYQMWKMKQELLGKMK